jgi:hypothetical protein
VGDQNAQLERNNTALVLALAKQQKTDATLPPTELAARLNTLVPTAGTTVTPTGVALPEAGAVATVQQLEQIPVLTQQLAGAQQEAKNDLSLLTASTGQVVTLNAEVSGLRLEAVDQAKVCDARVKVETDKIHKARSRWFKIGFIAGFLSRQIIKTETGW